MIATAAFNQAPLDLQQCFMPTRKRHDSLERLLAVAKIKGVIGPAALALELMESPQVVTNWGIRGVSKHGAMKAQERFGCDANWLLRGGDRGQDAPPVKDQSGGSDDAQELAFFFDKLTDVDDRSNVHDICMAEILRVLASRAAERVSPPTTTPNLVGRQGKTRA